ncbi:MAG: MBL fold metallo-hydrolase, partial [Lawsonibacter sp.]|nr:MBL fold metallo-hydrolase [Lawsonibacter sp.]
PAPQQVFFAHGDAPITELFAGTLNEKVIPAHAPLFEEVYDLLENRMLSPGVVLETKPKASGAAAPTSAAFLRLQDVSKELELLISRSRGRPNKSLAKLADQLHQVMAKWGS